MRNIISQKSKFISRKCLTIPNGSSKVVNRRRMYNTMTKRNKGH